MLKLSTKGIYGVTAMLDLAINGSESQSIKNICERTGITEKYLEQIFISLRKAGIIKSIRGPKGGYLLTGSPEDITVGQVLRGAEGSIAPVDCVACDDSQDCIRSDECITRLLWQDIRQGIDKFVDTISLADLTEKYHEWIYTQSFMLYI